MAPRLWKKGALDLWRRRPACVWYDRVPPPPPLSFRRGSTQADLLGAADGISHYFGNRPDAAWAEWWLTFFDLERMFGAWDVGAVGGGAGSFAFSLTIPGGKIPVAGVTVVGVLPTHRRRGVLTGLMTASSVVIAGVGRLCRDRRGTRARTLRRSRRRRSVPSFRRRAPGRWCPATRCWNRRCVPPPRSARVVTSASSSALPVVVSASRYRSKKRRDFSSGVLPASGTGRSGARKRVSCVSGSR